MGLGAGIALLLAFAAMHLAWMARNIDPTMLIILVLAACYILYLIRHFYRLAYGSVEILIGLFAIFGAMHRAVDGVADAATLVQMAAGMYVIIRGFDNFAQAQPFKGGSAPFRDLWPFIWGRWGTEANGLEAALISPARARP
jgi:ethanolamine transporter EutH